MNRMQIFPQAAGGGAGSGSVWYSGSGAPAGGAGVDGDYYLNTANGDVYAKVSGSWGSAIENLTGATGGTGATGTNGTNGTDGTIASRGDIAFTTGSLAIGASESSYAAAFAKSYAIVKLTVTAACRLRLYSTATQRDADVGRAAGTPPSPGTAHGVVGEWVLDGTPTAPLSNFICSPEVYGANADGPVTSNLYYTVTNLSGGSVAITVTLTTKIEEA